LFNIGIFLNILVASLTFLKPTGGGVVGKVPGGLGKLCS